MGFPYVATVGWGRGKNRGGLQINPTMIPYDSFSHCKAFPVEKNVAKKFSLPSILLLQSLLEKQNCVSVDTIAKLQV